MPDQKKLLQSSLLQEKGKELCRDCMYCSTLCIVFVLLLGLFLAIAFFTFLCVRKLFVYWSLFSVCICRSISSPLCHVPSVRPSNIPLPLTLPALMLKLIIFQWQLLIKLFVSRISDYQCCYRGGIICWSIFLIALDSVSKYLSQVLKWLLLL